MKKTLTLFLSIFAFFTLTHAQNLTINVHVQDSSGNPVEEVEVTVIDSIMNVVLTDLTDPDGNATFDFNPDSNLIGNWYYVLIEDCNGYFLYEIVTYEGGTQQTDVTFTYCADPPPPCGVDIYSQGAGTPQEILVALPAGVPPFSYNWSDGSTSEYFQPPGPGTYCVTVTDALGCMADACHTVDSNAVDSSCYVSINAFYEPALGGWALVASGSGNGAFSFSWDNGELGDTIFVVDNGTYCVTMTDGIGCQSVACIQIGQNACDLFFTYSNTGLLMAIPTGLSPYEFLWDTGDTTAYIQAQAGDEYCVTVTDALGCTVFDCFTPDSNTVDSICWVDIWVNGNPNGTGGLILEAVGQGVPPFDFAWNTGETGPVINVIDSGEYCVTMADAQGCTTTACITVDGRSSQCGLQLLCDPPGTLTAWAWGSFPISYDWDTGDTTETIAVSPGNTYCVTITDASGCTSDACMYVDSIPNWPDSLCTIFVQTFIDYDEQEAELIAWGTSPFMDYYWSTGEFGQSIVVDSPGNYCVTGIDSNFNCQVTQCVSVDFLPDSSANSIGGFVYGGPTQTPSGQVLLIMEDSTGNLSVLDTTPVPGPVGGTNCPCYLFTNLAAGTYYTQFIPDDPLLIPTYHTSAAVYTDADPISVPTNSPSLFHDILVLSASPLMGPGFIGGSIIDGGNFDMGNSRNSDPMSGVSVVLTDAANFPLDQIYTNAAGEFSFGSLPWGIYRLHIDYLNAEPKMIEVELTPSNPVITEVMLTFDGDQFTTDIREISEVAGVSVYPNPFSDRLNLDVETGAEARTIYLRNVSGGLLRTIELAPGDRKVSMDLSGIPQGMYIVELEFGSNVWFERVLKID